MGRLKPGQKSIFYKLGNVVIEDKRPPQYKEVEAPPPLPPKVFTRDPILASVWMEDGDQPDPKPLPPDAVPVRMNAVSLLALCHRNHVLILQLRRMAGIGPALFNLLHSRSIRKLSFAHTETSELLSPLGIDVQGGCSVVELILKYREFAASNLQRRMRCRATERSDTSDEQHPLQQLKEHQVASVVTGVDISDRDFYTEEWNNPLLCER